MKIAKSTLKMTPAGALIMGGMDYPTAYRFVFRADIKDRLQALVSEYGENPKGLNWELNMYGWDNPSELLKLL